MKGSKSLLVLALGLAGLGGAHAQNVATDALNRFTATDVQRELARAIGTLCLPGNRLTPRLQNDCNNLVGGAFNLDNGVRNALASIVANNATNPMDQSLLGRLGTIRPPASYTGASFAALAQDDAAMMALNLSEDGAAGFGWSMFLNMRFDSNERDASFNEDGFDRDGQALVLGLDRRVSNNFAFGIAVGVGRGELDFTGNSGSLDTDELGFNLYANWQADNGFYVDTLLAANERENDQVRIVAYGVGANVVDQRYDATFDSSERLLALTAGFRFSRGAWSFDPYARIEYIDAESDAYSERSRTPENNGAGWTLDVAAQDETFSRAAIGLRMAYAISAQNGVYQPYLDISYIRAAGLDEDAARVRFRGDASTAVNLSPLDFFMIADAEDRTVGMLSLGMSAQWQNGWSGFLGYRQNFAESRYEHREFNAGLRVEF